MVGTEGNHGASVQTHRCIDDLHISEEETSSVTIGRDFAGVSLICVEFEIEKTFLFGCELQYCFGCHGGDDNVAVEGPP